MSNGCISGHVQWYGWIKEEIELHIVSFTLLVSYKYFLSSLEIIPLPKNGSTVGLCLFDFWPRRILWSFFALLRFECRLWWRTFLCFLGRRRWVVVSSSYVSATKIKGLLTSEGILSSLSGLQVQSLWVGLSSADCGLVPLSFTPSNRWAGSFKSTNGFGIYRGRVEHSS